MHLCTSLVSLVLACAMLLNSTGTYAAGSDFKWWTTSSPNATNNGTITLKNAGGTTRTIISNPTGAYLSTRTANTQPPSVVIQATAALPRVPIGSICVTGTDTAAISSADQRTLLTCGASNTWQITSRISLPVVTEGSACNIATDGNGAVDATGLFLSCQSGVWKSLGGTDVALKAANGYTKLPSGLIIQWGSTQAATVTFPIPFPNAVLARQLAINDFNSTGSPAGQYYAITSITNTGFTVAQSICCVAVLRWMAIGY